MKTINKLWMLIALLIVLTPLGLVIPEYLKAGSAWGEWGPDEIKGLVGYIPQGLARLSSLWAAPIPDYAFRGLEEKALPARSASYIISAIAGILVTVAAIWLINKFFKRGN